eukprot:scaffold27517_cov42-Cyclotella_meneghiniana.AAC.2
MNSSTVRLWLPALIIVTDMVVVDSMMLVLDSFHSFITRKKNLGSNLWRQWPLKHSKGSRLPPQFSRRRAGSFPPHCHQQQIHVARNGCSFCHSIEDDRETKMEEKRKIAMGLMSHVIMGVHCVLNFMSSTEVSLCPELYVIRTVHIVDSLR